MYLFYYVRVLMMMNESKLAHSISSISNAKSRDAFSRVILLTYYFIHEKSSSEIFSNVINPGKINVVFLSCYHFRSFIKLSKQALRFQWLYSPSVRTTKLSIRCHLIFLRFFVTISSILLAFSSKSIIRPQLIMIRL